MLSFTNTTLTSPGGSTTYTSGNPALLAPNQLYIFPWIATFRDNTTGTNQVPSLGTIYDESCRTATTCYMRGLKEKITIGTTDGSSWLWRRVCFTFKGNKFSGQTTSGFAMAAENSAGFARLVNSVGNGTSNNIVAPLLDTMFQGGINQDWTDPMNAQLNKKRVTVKYDKVVRLSSGNTGGIERVVSRWHPMNSNLVYDDDEAGELKYSGTQSTTGKAGMGDYYVIDFIRCNVPITPSGNGQSLMSFLPEATLYWHEK